MGKWFDAFAAAALLIALVVFCIDAFATWRDCTAAGGTTVRGLFRLECTR